MDKINFAATPYFAGCKPPHNVWMVHGYLEDVNQTIDVGFFIEKTDTDAPFLSASMTFEDAERLRNFLNEVLSTKESIK